MKRRQSARMHLYASGSCWPSNFGLATSQPRLWSLFSWLSTMECAARLAVTRQDARFPKRSAFVPSRAYIHRPVFWIFCNTIGCKLSKLYFLPQFFRILLSTFVQILNLARHCISSRSNRRCNLATKFYWILNLYQSISRSISTNFPYKCVRLKIAGNFSNTTLRSTWIPYISRATLATDPGTFRRGCTGGGGGGVWK
jgi:hypothetical protein